MNAIKTGMLALVLSALVASPAFAAINYNSSKSNTRHARTHNATSTHKTYKTNKHGNGKSVVNKKGTK